ncbi:MAG: archease [Candidatus Babeliales bacterium]
MIKDFEIIPHTADLKIRVYGKTLEELFRNAIIGMFQSIGPRAESCFVENDRLICSQLPIERKIELHSIDLDILLVDFLSEALFLSDSYNEAYLDAKIKTLDDKNISAILYGIKINRFEVVEIKAVTFHDLSIKQVNSIWETNIVFDI